MYCLWHVLHDVPIMMACAGANIRADATQQYNITIELLDGEIMAGGIYGLRVDYWDEHSSNFPPGSSLFFYDVSHILTVGAAGYTALLICPS